MNQPRADLAAPRRCRAEPRCCGRGSTSTPTRCCRARSGGRPAHRPGRRARRDPSPGRDGSGGCEMTPTRLRDLLINGVVTAVVVYLLVRLSYGVLPPLPAAGRDHAAGARGRRGPFREHPAGPNRASAGDPAGPAADRGAGGDGGQGVRSRRRDRLGNLARVLVYVLPLGSDLAAASHDTASAAVGLVCALALVGGALWLERCCRTPTDGETRTTRTDRPRTDVVHDGR